MANENTTVAEPRARVQLPAFGVFWNCTEVTWFRAASLEGARVYAAFLGYSSADADFVVREISEERWCELEDWIGALKREAARDQHSAECKVVSGEALAARATVGMEVAA